MPQGKPVKPAWLTGRGAELWDEVSGFAFWLGRADSYKLAAWCDGQAGFESPKKRREWTASDRREHRGGCVGTWDRLSSMTAPRPTDPPEMRKRLEFQHRGVVVRRIAPRKNDQNVKLSFSEPPHAFCKSCVAQHLPHIPS